MTSLSTINTVCGFLFRGSAVLLSRKERPAWAQGKLNGVVGEIVDGTPILEAMVRVFREATGVLVASSQWCCFASVSGYDVVNDRDYSVNFCWTRDDSTPMSAYSHPDLEWYTWKELPNDVIHNLRWLIPLALDPYVHQFVAVQNEPVPENKSPKVC